MMTRPAISTLPSAVRLHCWLHYQAAGSTARLAVCCDQSQIPLRNLVQIDAPRETHKLQSWTDPTNKWERRPGTPSVARPPIEAATLTRPYRVGPGVADSRPMDEEEHHPTAHAMACASSPFVMLTLSANPPLSCVELQEMYHLQVRSIGILL